MFNKGKALLLSILGSMALMLLFTVIERFCPFEEIFHYSNEVFGWHSIWMLILIYLINKNKKSDPDKKFEKTLWADVAIYTLFPPVGAQKSLYDLQKFKAQKEGLTVTKGTVLCVFSWFLYALYMLFYAFVIFLIVQEMFFPPKMEMKELETAISKIEENKEEIYSQCLTRAEKDDTIYDKEKFCQCAINSTKEIIADYMKRAERGENLNVREFKIELATTLKEKCENN